MQRSETQRWTFEEDLNVRGGQSLCFIYSKKYTEMKFNRLEKNVVIQKSKGKRVFKDRNNVSKRIKCLEINLTKEIEDLYIENCKTRLSNL